MTTLTEFLLARIAEDEAVANEARVDEHLHTRDDPELTVGEAGGYACVSATSGRVLAECEAKRRIVETRPFKVLDGGEERQADRLRSHVLRLLALPYADHPEYQEEWRP